MMDRDELKKLVRKIPERHPRYGLMWENEPSVTFNRNGVRLNNRFIDDFIQQVPCQLKVYVSDECIFIKVITRGEESPGNCELQRDKNGFILVAPEIANKVGNVGRHAYRAVMNADGLIEVSLKRGT